MEMVLPRAAYDGDDARRDFVERVLDRATGDPAALTSAAVGAVHGVDANQPVYDVMTPSAALGERTLGLQ